MADIVQGVKGLTYPMHNMIKKIQLLLTNEACKLITQEQHKICMYLPEADGFSSTSSGITRF